jgi:hypothetical protein
MINKWTTILDASLKELKTGYLEDEREIINEHDLKYKVRQFIEKVANIENDILVKPEVPWYDKNSEVLRPKFYFDLAVFRKSVFQLRLRDQAMRRKGFNYNDNSLAIMLKFVKPTFNFSEIDEDIEKLKVFADETMRQANQHKPILIIGITDDRLYKQTEAKIISTLKNYDNHFLSRLTIFYFNQTKFERLDCGISEI